jgi:hypothetical protein
MKSIGTIIGLGILTVSLLTARAADTPPGYVDFGKLTPGAPGSQFIEVNVSGNLISMAARLAEKSEPDLAQLLRKVQMVRVNVVGLTDENRADIQARIKAIRGDLDAKGWERIVTVQERQQDVVGVFLKTRGDESVQGLVVLVVEGGKQAVLVNIVGDIKPEQVGAIGEKFGIDPLKKMGKSMPKKHEQHEQHQQPENPAPEK